MAEEAVPIEEGKIAGGKRRRDATGYVVMRRPQPQVVGRASQADVDAEAYARFVGSWGNFSAHIGHRWEQIAGDWSKGKVGEVLGLGDEEAYMLRHVEELDRNVELHREVERVGVSCPDALFCGRDAGAQVIIQPVDYKVSLDTAGFDQVEAERILDLATRGGEHTVRAIWKAAALVAEGRFSVAVEEREALLAGLSAGAVMPVDGLFVSPDTAFNRVHLRSRQNQQRRRPLRFADVLLVSIAPEQCFGGLPGWEEAQALLHADHVRADLPGDLGMAERYARLGAGVVGALHTIHCPLFGPPATIDTAGELQSLLATHPSSLAVLNVLQERRAARLDLLRRRDRLLHFPFRMPALIEALGPIPDSGGQAAWPSTLLREGIASLHNLHRTRVAEDGEHMVGRGLADTAVLGQLEEDWPVYRRAARADLERWAIAARHGSAGET